MKRIGELPDVRANQKNDRKEGHADKVIERFSSEGVIEKQEGLIDVTVLEKKSAAVMKKSSC